MYRPVRNDHWRADDRRGPRLPGGPRIFRHASSRGWPTASRGHPRHRRERHGRPSRIARGLPGRVIITDVPGKRDALRPGWEAAPPRWSRSSTPTRSGPTTSPTRSHALRRPARRRRQHPAERLQPAGFLQHVNDMYLDYRYFDENAVADGARPGRVLHLRPDRGLPARLLLRDSDDFMTESFLGGPCMSGDDKRLTSLILERGHRPCCSGAARVWSTFPGTSALLPAAPALVAQHLALRPAGAGQPLGVAATRSSRTRCSTRPSAASRCWPRRCSWGMAIARRTGFVRLLAPGGG